MRALTLIVTSLLLFAACEPEETVVSAQPEQLVGEWQLVEPASKYTVTLQFSINPQQGFIGYVTFRLGGRAPVNGYGAQAHFSKGPSIESGPSSSGNVWDVISTMIAGSPEASQFEQAYLGNLQNVKRYEFTSKNRLRLHYEGAQPGVLVYEKIN